MGGGGSHKCLEESVWCAPACEWSPPECEWCLGHMGVESQGDRNAQHTLRMHIFRRERLVVARHLRKCARARHDARARAPARARTRAGRGRALRARVRAARTLGEHAARMGRSRRAPWCAPSARASCWHAARASAQSRSARAARFGRPPLRTWGRRPRTLQKAPDKARKHTQPWKILGSGAGALGGARKQRRRGRLLLGVSRGAGGWQLRACSPKRGSLPRLVYLSRMSTMGVAHGWAEVGSTGSSHENGRSWLGFGRYFGLRAPILSATPMNRVARSSPPSMAS